MATADIKVGTKFKRHHDTVFVVKTITDKRVVYYTGKYGTASGRQVSTDWQGIKSFNEELKSGVIKVLS